METLHRPISNTTTTGIYSSNISTGYHTSAAGLSLQETVTGLVPPPPPTDRREGKINSNSSSSLAQGPSIIQSSPTVDIRQLPAATGGKRQNQGISNTSNGSYYNNSVSKFAKDGSNRDSSSTTASAEGKLGWSKFTRNLFGKC
jgi:hypothetical protein